MGDKEDVRSKLDIVDFIGQRIQLKPAGRNFKGLCPFHQEKSPSFFVSPERQMYKCFGCGKSGDVFSFYMEQEGVGFSEALRDLAQQAGVELTNFQPTQDFTHKQKLIEISLAAADFYHYLLTKHQIGKKALEYLQERGVTPTQIRDFKLGYAPDNWQALTDFLTKKKKFHLNDLEETGLTIKSDRGGYDRFRGRVMFPLYDHRGNLVAFSGRILPWTDDGKSGKYINSPETPIYHKSQMLFPLHMVKDAIRKANNVVIVEGELDVLASLRANIGYTVAVKGSALTDQQVKLLNRYCQTITLALDADSAGVAAAKRAITVAQAAEMNIKVVELSQGKDPDELVKTDPAAWRQVVKQAVGVYDFFLAQTQKNHDSLTIDGKQAISAEIVPLLSQIENRVIQDFYIKKLATLLQVEKEVIEQEIERYSKKKELGNTSNAQETTVAVKPRVMLLADELLALVLTFYDKIAIETIPIEDMNDSALTKILAKLLQDKPKDVVSFAKTLPAELQAQFDTSFLLELPNYSDKEVVNKIQELSSQLAKLSLRDRLSRL
ncbi:DNA primase, partial [Candidatus Beckwithbacteria bacterium]|nr:DNA primase [Candidatus Beckwithbacteria bacterium]